MNRSFPTMLLYPCLLILLSLYATGCVALYVVQDDMIFPGTKRPRTPTPQLPPQTQILKREIAPDQFVEAWYFPHPSATAQNPAPLAVLFHGNSERIDDMADAVEHFLQMGWSCLLPEYRGYNRSAGKPSQAAIHDDAVFFLTQTLARPEVNAKCVVYYGRSLGGGVACDLTRAHMPQGLILTSTFISVAKIAQGYLAPEFLVKHPFHNDTVVESFPGPILISHGTYDTIIPVKHGQTLAKLAKHATYREYDCNHNDFPGTPQAYDQYWASIQTFLQAISRQAQSH